MLVLCKVMRDGSIVHSEFSQSAWNSSFRDPDIASRWGHREGDCRDPVTRFFAGLRRRGYELWPQAHAKADLEDPGWVGSRGVEPKEAVETAKSLVPWPPEVELTAWALCQLSKLCMDDAKDVLRAPPKYVPTVDFGPKVDRKGQYMLW